MTNRKFTYLTEFSGLGGSALGLQQAGGEGKLAIEFDPTKSIKNQNAFDHLKLNFPEMHKKDLLLNKDITTIDGDKMLEIMDIPKYSLDMFQTSFPCQGFSMSNTARDVEDERNNLFYNSLEHISKIMPAVLIGENVGGLAAGVMKNSLIKMKEALEDTGYTVRVFKLNASDYGAPQLRSRVWILGVRSDLGIVPTAPDKYGTVVGVTQVLPHIESTESSQFMCKRTPGHLPMGTLTKTPGMKVVVNGVARRPTTEELRVLSCFPKSFKFTGTPSQIHERLGNCVLPLQMKVLAEHLYDTVIAKIDPLYKQALIAGGDEAFKLAV